MPETIVKRFGSKHSDDIIRKQPMFLMNFRKSETHRINCYIQIIFYDNFKWPGSFTA